MGRSAAGIRADFPGGSGNAAVAMGVPGSLQEGPQTLFIVPAHGAAGLRRRQHAGHGAVHLADAQHRTPGRQVLEQLPGQDRPVLRIVAQRQQQHRRAPLFPHRIRVLAIAQGNDIVDKPGRIDGRQDFPVHLSSQAQTQRSPELPVGSSHLPQHFPQCQRVAVGGEKAGMRQVEMPVPWWFRTIKVGFVIAVGDAGHGRFCHGLKVLLQERRAGQNRTAAVQHPLFHAAQTSPTDAGHGQVLQVIHLAPRVAKVRNPRNAQGLVQAQPDQVHRMRWTGRDHDIHRMLLQIGFEAFDGRAHPSLARVRHKKIGPNPQGQALFEGFGTGRYFRHLRAPGPGELAIGCIRLPDGPAEHLHLRRHLCGKRVVQRRVIGMLGRPHDGLPSLRTQVFDKLHPTLHAGTSRRRPVIRYDQHPFHRPSSSFIPRSKSKA